ncbi:MAG: histidine kinase dimerization/phosphoacceptor domain -containing protein [Ekhidna sp.]
MKRLLVLSCLLAVFIKTSHAQNYQDSLLSVLADVTDVAIQKEVKLQLGEYLVQLNPEQAELYADEVAGMAGTPEDSLEWARLNYIYAASHRWQGNYATSLEYYQRNYDFFVRTESREEIARSGTKIGTINTFLGNNVLAQKYLLESAALYGEIGTPKEKASINSRLAGLYLNLDQIDKGKERYMLTLQEFTIINDSMGMAGANANLGYVYIVLGNYEMAEKHLQAQKGLNKVFPTLREMGFHYDFMGLLRQEQGRLEEAYESHLMALEIRKDLSSTYNLCESRLSTGEVLIKLGRFTEAIGHLEDVLSYEEHNSLNQESEAHRLLSLAYERQHNFSKSLANYKAYKTISDSIYNESSIQVIAEKDAQFKKKEQDAEIKILSQENEIATQRAKRSRIIIYGSLVGLFTFTVLSFFIFRLYKKVKGQKDVISKSLAEKETLLKEIHHRVKNNLQVVSSLLSMQSRFITDEKALGAVNEGQTRVESMALIHQKLYQENNLSGVHAKEYIEDLSEILKQSYTTGPNIDFEYEIDDLLIDVDTIIPIGLILNELICNSLKHAFPDAEEGLIKVGLKEEANELKLEISDNGVGSELHASDKSFGMVLIESLAMKLKATLQVDSTNGTTVTLNISKYKLV